MGILDCFCSTGKWEERLAKDAGDVMAAARALDDKIRIETEVHTRTERDIDNVEVYIIQQPHAPIARV